MPTEGVTVMDVVMRATAVQGTSRSVFETEREPLEFVPIVGAVYTRVRVVARGSGKGSVRIVDVAGAMRGGAGAHARVSAGEIVIVPASVGEWTEARLEAELARSVVSGEEATP
jgi:hypothetical protein